MLGGLKKAFQLGGKKFLGIDIGTASIRIVEIEKKGQIYKLENYGEVEISAVDNNSFLLYKKDTLLLSNKKIATTIDAIRREAGIGTKEVNFSIPDFCSFFTNFELPPMAISEISEAIKYEVRPYIPLPLSDITLDWSIVDHGSPDSPIKVLVVAVPNDIIGQYKEIANLSGLNLRILEPEIFSLARSLNIGTNNQKIISIIDVGLRSTTCGIVEKGVLKMSHSFNVAGNELTEAIVRSLDIDYLKAEDIKKKYGVYKYKETAENTDNNDKGSVNDGTKKSQFASKDKKDDVQKIILPLIDTMVGEIKKIFRDFYQKEGKEVQEVILAGGTSLVPGFKEYFSNELKKETILANPFLGISCPDAISEILKNKGPSYAVAVGVALKGLE